MALKDIVPVRRQVEHGGQTFDIQGLTLRDIAGLINSHKEEVTPVFEGKVSVEVLIQKSPEVVARIIAYAAGEADAVENARSLPLEVQLDALRQIWEMTVLDEVEFVKSLRHLIGGLGRVAEKMGVQTPKLPGQVKIKPGKTE